MRYRELREALDSLTPDQLEQDVMLFMSWVDSYYSIEGIGVAVNTDVLDDDHIVLTVGGHETY